MAREVVVDEDSLIGDLTGSDGGSGKWGTIVVEKEPTRASTSSGFGRPDCTSDILTCNPLVLGRRIDLHMPCL